MFHAHAVSATPDAGEVNEADRIAILVAVGTCHARDRDGEICVGMGKRAVRHGDGHLLAHHPAALDESRIETQGRAFVVGRVANECAVEIIRRAWRFAQHGGDQAAGARLCRNDAQLAALG